MFLLDCYRVVGFRRCCGWAAPLWCVVSRWDAGAAAVVFAAWERPGSAGSRAALPGPGWRVFLDRPRLGCDVSDRFHVAFVCNITGKNAAVSKGIYLSLVWSLLS